MRAARKRTAIDQTKSSRSFGRERRQDDRSVRFGCTYKSEIIARNGVRKILLHPHVLVERNHSEFAIAFFIIDHKGQQTCFCPQTIEMRYCGKHSHRSVIEIDSPLFIVEPAANMPRQHIGSLK